MGSELTHEDDSALVDLGHERFHPGQQVRHHGCAAFGMMGQVAAPEGIRHYLHAASGPRRIHEGNPAGDDPDFVRRLRGDTRILMPWRVVVEILLGHQPARGFVT